MDHQILPEFSCFHFKMQTILAWNFHVKCYHLASRCHHVGECTQCSWRNKKLKRLKKEQVDYGPRKYENHQIHILAPAGQK